MTMAGLNRREAAARLGELALLPFVAVALPTRANAAAVTPAKVVGNYRLGRTLMCELKSGVAIVVTRAWKIAISSKGEGLIVTGQQIAAEVAAPPALARLAAMEQARDASGLFPMALDAAGQVLRSVAAANGAMLDRGIDTARTLFASLPSARIPSEAEGFATGLASMGAGAVSQLPRDLFFPTAGTQVAERTVPLPGGQEGQISVAVSANVAHGSGLLETSERRIVTRIGEGARLSSERWVLIATS